jgi:hypothetical protein
VRKKRKATVGKRNMKNFEEAYIHSREKCLHRYHLTLTMPVYKEMNESILAGEARFIDCSSHKDRDRTRWVVQHNGQEYFVVFSKKLNCVLTFLPLSGAKPMEVSPVKKFYRSKNDFSKDFVLTWTCKQCRKEYAPSKPDSEYCSQTCERLYTVGIPCLVCRRNFNPTEEQQVYCGRACKTVGKSKRYQESRAKNSGISLGSGE